MPQPAVRSKGGGDGTVFSGKTTQPSPQGTAHLFDVLTNSVRPESESANAQPTPNTVGSLAQRFDPFVCNNLSICIYIPTAWTRTGVSASRWMEPQAMINLLMIAHHFRTAEVCP